MVAPSANEDVQGPFPCAVSLLCEIVGPVRHVVDGSLIEASTSQRLFMDINHLLSDLLYGPRPSCDGSWIVESSQSLFTEPATIDPLFNAELTIHRADIPAG